MQSMLTRMFKRNSIIEAIEELHTGILKTFDDRAAHAGRAELTPLDILCLPESNGIAKPDQATLNTVNQMMLTPGKLPKTMSQFGVYSMIQCTILDRNHRFIQSLLPEGWDLTKTLYNPHELQEISLLTCRSSAALSMKYCWLYFRRKQGYTERYYGNPSCSGPVKTFMLRHYGLTNPSQPQVNEITFAIAHEIDMDPLDVNSAMWLMEQM